MYCSNCGKEFDGKFCPECRTPANHPTPVYSSDHDDTLTPKPKKKKFGCLIALLFIATVFVTLAFLVAGDDDKTQSSSSEIDVPRSAAIAAFEAIGCEYADLCTKIEDWAEGEKYSLYYNGKTYIAYIKDGQAESVRCQDEGLDYYMQDGEVLKKAQ